MPVDPVDPVDILPVGVDPWDTLTTLSSSVTSLRSDLDSVIEHLTEVLIPQVNDLETSTLETGTPAMTLIRDSGWIDWDRGDAWVICNVPNLNVFVYMVGTDSNRYRHQIGFGGKRELTKREGAYWYIDYDYDLVVYRREDDDDWREVRVWVWQINN